MAREGCVRSFQSSIHDIHEAEVECESHSRRSAVGHLKLDKSLERLQNTVHCGGGDQNLSCVSDIPQRKRKTLLTARLHSPSAPSSSRRLCHHSGSRRLDFTPISEQQRPRHLNTKKIFTHSRALYTPETSPASKAPSNLGTLPHK